MKRLLAFASGPEGQGFRQSVPVCDLSEWRDNGINASFSNCTNFAYHRNTLDYLQPGALAPPGSRLKSADIKGGFRRYAGNTKHNAVQDGLIPFGDRLGLAGAPVALFFMHGASSWNGCHDYDWMALKREFDRNTGKHDRLFWARKIGYDSAEDCAPYDEDIFAAARDAGYTHFGGYFTVPQEIMILK